LEKEESREKTPHGRSTSRSPLKEKEYHGMGTAKTDQQAKMPLEKGKNIPKGSPSEPVRDGRKRSNNQRDSTRDLPLRH